MLKLAIFKGPLAYRAECTVIDRATHSCQTREVRHKADACRHEQHCIDVKMGERQG